MLRDRQPADDHAAPRLQEPKPRIVQFNNRRYSIRLEPAFWQALERQAGRRGLGLGKYIGSLAEAFDGRNFSSYLRVLCMLESERAEAHASLRPRRAGLMDLVLTAFEPALVLSRYRTIIAYNTGLLDWLGRESRPVAGSNLTSVLQVRTRRPLNELWLDLIAGTIISADVSVLHVRPGRALTAAARLIAMPAGADAEFYAVLWISPSRRSAIGRLEAEAAPVSPGSGRSG